jgi:hypothetical protein
MKFCATLSLFLITTLCISQSITVTASKQDWYGGTSYNSGTIYTITIVCDSSELKNYTFLSAELEENSFIITESSIKHRTSHSIIFCFEVLHDHGEILDEIFTDLENPVKTVNNTLCFIQNDRINQISIPKINELFPIHYP